MEKVVIIWGEKIKKYSPFYYNFTFSTYLFKNRCVICSSLFSGFDRRPFVTPRVLQPPSSARDNSTELEESDKEEVEDYNTKVHGQFVENPEVLRARLAERRLQKQYSRSFRPPQSRDVVGKYIICWYLMLLCVCMYK